MSARAIILKRLIDSQNVAVERAVEVALLEGSPAEQHELADVLLERNRRAGWVTLIRAYHRLDESIREKLLTRPRDLFGPLADTMHDLEGPARENVIAIIQRCTDARLVYLLAEALMDSRTDVRTMAGNTLLDAVRKHWQAAREKPTEAGDGPSPARQEADASGGDQLRRAVDVALQQYRKHRQSTTVLAALIHERQQNGPLWTLLQDPYDDRTRAATIILRAPGEPAVAGALLIALGTSLKSAAMAGLAALEDVEVAIGVAAESFRLLDPVLGEVAWGITHLKLLPALRKAPPWTRANWSSWLRIIELVGLQPPERLGWLVRLLEAAPLEPEACAWKVSVARAIAATGTVDAGVPLSNLMRDPDERVARFAARLLLNRKKPEWRERAANGIPKSIHPSVRRLEVYIGAAQSAASTAETPQSPSAREFQKVWSDFQQMPPAVQHSTARQMAAEAASAEQLRLKFQGSPQEISQALRMIAALPSLLPYRAQIISLCGHVDPRIAAMAVRLVARLEDPKLKELLEAATHHADARVRANAIESMDALHIVDRSQQVLAMLNSRHNRERANAIKALGQFNFGTARECLGRMLSDSNPLHRMSALWVVSQLNLLEIMRQISNMARRDANVRVRKRAAEMLETLSGNLTGPL